MTSRRQLAPIDLSSKLSCAAAIGALGWVTQSVAADVPVSRSRVLGVENTDGVDDASGSIGTFCGDGDLYDRFEAALVFFHT